jgi:hypothetical protein
MLICTAASQRQDADPRRGQFQHIGFVIQRLTRRRTERQGDFQRQQRQPAERYR